MCNMRLLRGYLARGLVILIGFSMSLFWVWFILVVAESFHFLASDAPSLWRMIRSFFFLNPDPPVYLWYH